MKKQLPKKLKKDPVIEAVFEMRFSPSVLAVNIIPGILFAKNARLKIDKLSTADIPQQFRDANPSFRYLPQCKMEWDNYTILVGDRMFAIADNPPYKGWSNFKKIISEITDNIKQANLITDIERYSLKYVSFIEAESIKEQLKLVKYNLQIGSHKIDDNNVNIQIEIPNDKYIHIIQLLSNGTVQIRDSLPKKGIIITIDSIVNGPFEDFWDKLPANVEKLHEIDKELFFDFLPDTTINKLEPMYEE